MVRFTYCHYPDYLDGISKKRLMGVLMVIFQCGLVATDDLT